MVGEHPSYPETIKHSWSWISLKFEVDGVVTDINPYVAASGLNSPP